MKKKMVTATPVQPKKPKLIVTARQRKAARAVIENLRSTKPRSHKQVLSSVGYGTGLQDQPQRVLGSEGFKQAVREMGLTEDLIVSSLTKDIKKKPQNRLGELRLGAEILGMKQDESLPPPRSGNVYNFIFGADMQKKIRGMEDEIKGLLTQPNPNAETN